MLSRVFKIILLVVIFFAVSWILFLSKQKEDFSFTSHIPDFLTLQKNKQVTLLDLWEPFFKSMQKEESTDVVITAKSYLMYDLTTDKVLFEKQPKTHLPMASLTKIITENVSLEHPRRDGNLTVPGSDQVGVVSIGL